MTTLAQAKEILDLYHQRRLLREMFELTDAPYITSCVQVSTRNLIITPSEAQSILAKRVDELDEKLAALGFKEQADAA